jgi:sigma-B regulation protein RsbU (phosphoserine phosphatase)
MDENSLLAQTDGKDPPIGLIPGTHYRQIAFKLAPADLLALYTDGLSEAMDGAGQELSRRRLLELVGSLPVGSPVAMGEALLDAVSAFCQDAPASDDQALVILQFRG